MRPAEQMPIDSRSTSARGRRRVIPAPPYLPARLLGRIQSGRQALMAFLPGLVVAAGILSGLAPSTRVLGLSTTATHVIAFIFGTATLAIIRSFEVAPAL